MSERVAKDIVKAIAPVVQDRGTALLVEDPRLAAHAGADGVHVAGAGEDLAAALDSLKPERIVGAGTLADRDAAMEAGERGVDYLMFGDRDETPEATLDKVAWWVEIFNVPCVGLAHRLDEVEALARTGVEFVGLGEAFWENPGGIAQAVAKAQAVLVRVASALPATGPT
jgi:thiamine-phosphate pyrophosphorylase